MKALVLPKPAPIETSPLMIRELSIPVPGQDEVLVKVNACGMCRTDLHVVEGELAPKLQGVIPGHQVVGRIVGRGVNATTYADSARVGIPWLHRTDQTC